MSRPGPTAPPPQAEAMCRHEAGEVLPLRNGGLEPSGCGPLRVDLPLPSSDHEPFAAGRQTRRSRPGSP